jgi:hypothetical protein
MTQGGRNGNEFGEDVILSESRSGFVGAACPTHFKLMVKRSCQELAPVF